MRRFLPAGRAAPFLQFEQAVVFGERDPVEPLEVVFAVPATALGRELALAILRVGGPAQAPLGVDLGLVALAPGIDRRQPALAILGIIGIALAVALGLLGHLLNLDLEKEKGRGVGRRAPGWAEWFPSMAHGRRRLACATSIGARFALSWGAHEAPRLHHCIRRRGHGLAARRPCTTVNRAGGGRAQQRLGRCISSAGRSEERRVGKECRSGWSTYH